MTDLVVMVAVLAFAALLMMPWSEWREDRRERKACVRCSAGIAVILASREDSLCDGCAAHRLRLLSLEAQVFPLAPPPGPFNISTKQVLEI